MAIIKTKADYRKGTPYFCPYNNNPNAVRTGDCVIRAFAKAANIEWLTAFDLLVKKAREAYRIPNGKDNYNIVLQEYGFERKSVKVEKGKKRMTVEDFCKAHPKGRYCVSVANHLTAVVDGVCYDTWNPANCCVYLYYELKK